MPDLVTPTQQAILHQAQTSSGFVTIRTEQDGRASPDGAEAKAAAENLITRRMLTFARHDHSAEAASVAWTYRLTPFGKSVLEVLAARPGPTTQTGDAP